MNKSSEKEPPLLLRNDALLSESRYAAAVAAIPKAPVDLNYTTTLAVALHKKGGLFVQESSYSNLGIAMAALIGAVVVVFLPWHPPQNLKWWLLGGLVWIRFCGFGVFFVRNLAGDKVVVDPQEKTIRFRDNGSEKVVPWPKILGLQKLYQTDDGGGQDGYQLNLVWLDADGKVARHCLHKNKSKTPIAALARQYAVVLPLSQAPKF